jgi:predicted PurR-regulated permease PerM
MDKKQFKFIFGILALSILLVFVLWNFRYFLALLSKILMILRPIIIGFVLAFILNKPYKRINNLYSKIPKKKKHSEIISLLTLITVYALFFAFTIGVILIVIPQLVSSIEDFGKNINNYLVNFKNTTEKLYSRFNENLPENFNILDKLYGYIEKAPEFLKTLFISAFGFTQSLISMIVDIFLSIIISIYFLTGKDKLILQSRKIIVALFKEKTSKKILNAISVTNDTFSNFVSGQLIDAFILGTLCFIGMNIFKFEYAFLISLLIGLTNIIPIVGPFLGTIPCAFILFLINPIKAFWFVVFIILLQQIDSNIIYPRVVGNKVGLPALWVLVAILIGGGLFGIIGMLVAVPTMSIIYDLTRKKVNETLETKKINVK